ncbi:MAG: fibrinogen-like YCDxxxxGGGW domain-containing protein [Candidatus Gracilibacteria bacterium]|nr:fibrinogen-like YCDxxxxGGGW domain-containing protein [Candidatus Gracilibacteria bacterium]
MEKIINNPNPLSGAINKKVPDKGFRVFAAFTLVELIVVITILAILATVGFVSFSGYLAGARDTNRVSQLKSMSDALELYRTKKDLPIPDDKVDVRVGPSSNEETIAYQGYIGKNVLETIEYTESGLDPKDKTYFSYFLTKNKKFFQLLAFLEEENDDVVVLNLNKVSAIDYSDRKFIVKGKKLGILLTGTGTDLNRPVQEVESIISSGYLNIENTNDIYNAILENGYELTGTGTELKMLMGTILTGGVRNSCKVLLEKNSKLKGKDGYYLVNQELPTKVYCDMTTDGGGWTRYVNIKGNYSFDDAKQCWLAKSTWENTGKTIECFNPNRLNFIVSEYMVKQDGDNNGSYNSNEIWNKKFEKAYPSQIEEVAYNTTRACKGGIEYMAVMSSYSTGYPNNELTNLTYIRLGLSFCDENNGREIGGSRGTNIDFMNYSYYGKYGPSSGAQSGKGC